jgi:hypothetical protein
MANDREEHRRAKEEEGKRMGSVATGSDTMDYHDAHANGERHCYTWLEDYLERLAAKDDYREFQERYYGTPEYYTMVVALLAA